MALGEVVNFVGFATRIYALSTDDPIGRTRRPAISAGGLHPIHVLIVSKEINPEVCRYDGESHTLEFLLVRRPSALRRFVARAKCVLPDARGSYLVLLAETEKTSSVYEHPASLLWRDSGALLQTLHLSATAYGLAFCAMGILGHDFVSALFPAVQKVCAVGVASVGRAYGQ